MARFFLLRTEADMLEARRLSERSGIPETGLVAKIERLTSSTTYEMLDKVILASIMPLWWPWRSGR